MELLGELAIDLTDLVRARVRLDAEHFIGRLRHPGSALPYPRPLSGHLIDPNSDGALRTAADDRQVDRVADFRQADTVSELDPVVDRRAIDRDDQIVGPQAGAFGWRAGFDPGDHRPLSAGRAESLRNIGAEVLDCHSDVAVFDPAAADQLLHDLARHVDRYGKADPNIPSGWGHDRSVDADNSSLKIDQRPTRIARVDRSVGLDEILIALDTRAAAEGADNARGYSLAEAKRIADGEHKIADLQAA